MRWRSERGVVPGSTNQQQDAIDRHVAPGWCNGFHREWKGGSPCASTTATAEVIVVVAMAKKTEMVVRERKGSNYPDGRQRSSQAGRRKGRRAEGERSAHSVTLTGKPY